MSKALKRSSLLAFLLVGGCSFIVDISVFLTLSVYAEWQPMLARVCGFCVGLILTWIGNRLFTFRHRKQLNTLLQLRWVVIIAAISAGVNLSSFYLITQILGKQPLFMLVSVAIGVLLGLVVNWLGSNLITYKSLPA
ncbi:GtrA family protein [Shewanella donghaensis]|uniref:GtrA family protein n=1 Tax=Shewanella donghaensis TaxID=238836 RepID=UPI0011842827|nr:GtrA family protein [Shewanella donghaensis]